jgi:hypothetical protein
MSSYDHEMLLQQGVNVGGNMMMNIPQDTEDTDDKYDVA